MWITEERVNEIIERELKNSKTQLVAKIVETLEKDRILWLNLCEHREKNDESSGRERFLVEYIQGLKERIQLPRQY